jgi:hypothetical protein
VPDLINIGIAPNDHTGDDFRTVCLKLNAYLALLAVSNQSLVDQSALTALKAQIDLSFSGKLDKTGDASGAGVVPDSSAVVGRLARTAWDAAVSTAQASATDNLATFDAEMAERDAAGVLYRLTPGSFAFSSPLVQLPGRSVAGAGHAHLAFYQAQNASKRQNGTVLLVQGQAGKPTYALQGPRYGSVSLRGLSIYDTSIAAIFALLDMGRTMHARVVDVELAGLNARAPVGLNCDGDLTNGTLYAGFEDLKISNTKTAIRIRDVANALSFRGGSFEGSMYCLDIDGSIYNPTGIDFAGCSFENTFGPDTQIQYLADGTAIRGWPNAGPCYAAKLMRIAHCNGVSFDGCYYEMGGVPATYNDGTHGSLPVVPVISVEAGARGVDLGRLAYIYLLDAGEGTRATLNNGARYDGTRTVGLHVAKGSAQTIPAYAFTAVLFDGTPVQRDDTQIAYGSDGTITFKEAGDYDLNAVVYFEQVSGNVMARLQADLPGLRVLNGNSGYAPSGNFLSVGISATLLGMTTGQTLKIEVFQASPNSQTVQGYPTQTYCTLSKR